MLLNLHSVLKFGFARCAFNISIQEQYLTLVAVDIQWKFVEFMSK